MSLISRVMSRAAPAVSGDRRQIMALAWPMMVTAVVVSLQTLLEQMERGKRGLIFTLMLALLMVAFLREYRLLVSALGERDAAV
ncbi:hypothetical protein [Dickeya dianthicola]|uniref:hypothetical protein n=1 Tax=Dickeya dianthicola TaxID=204039 RepID=UPI00136CCD08|nr:hypothetical protein [Dickeya dianthicola]MCI4237329.1 hypothetical protein [Dickeya dianthicola]MCI4255091.1 hypothetical protein [Dickeya dianthicola]MZG21198.1 hypothetical protein [Dickeya dianthicola]